MQIKKVTDTLKVAYFYTHSSLQTKLIFKIRASVKISNGKTILLYIPSTLLLPNNKYLQPGFKHI